jgi:hypothetical protein
VARRSRAWWWSAALVVGDALSFLAFAASGTHQHGLILSPLDIALIAVPFALAWFVVAPWLGAFRRSLFDSPVRMLWRTELAWLCAWPVALILRVLIAPDHAMPWVFAVVILLANALFLGVWRTLFATLARFIP